jgi:hypothetical protein
MSHVNITLPSIFVRMSDFCRQCVEGTRKREVLKNNREYRKIKRTTEWEWKVFKIG